MKFCWFVDVGDGCVISFGVVLLIPKGGSYELPWNVDDCCWMLGALWMGAIYGVVSDVVWGVLKDTLFPKHYMQVVG